VADDGAERAEHLDGKSLPADAPEFRSVLECAGELGGRLSIKADPSCGTIVTVTGVRRARG
jgi:hypothetical protein